MKHVLLALHFMISHCSCR